MVKAIAVFLCGALAACSQTATAPQARQATTARTAAKANPAVANANPSAAAIEEIPPEYAALMARCEAAIKREQQKQVAGAMLGSALSMAGGFAGIGGAIAGEAVSVGRSLAQAGAENSARTAIEKERMP